MANSENFVIRATTCEGKQVTGDLFKKNGEFFVITGERDVFGVKKIFKVEPKTIELL